ncbi:inner nuclear membrane protein enriched at telomere/subtelomere region [Coemansia sp. RSA 1836]|nr:inner nuclear membrane protein enriched at telomere/subtelomere region [Coemansia sp. RSA 1836]
MVFGSHRKADEKKADEKKADEKKPKKMRPVPRAPGSPAKATMDKAAAARAGTKRKLSDAEADAQRQAAAAVDSGDEEFFTPAKPPASPSARPRKHVTAHATPNFSDENPFQSSPETARKRRRKAAPADDASHAAAAAPVTPMAALRKSHASDVSFRVALPRAAPASAPAPAPAPAPALPEEAAHDLDEDLHEEPFQPQPPKRAAELPGGTVEPLRRVELPDTAAPLARAVPTGPPRFSLAPPLASAPSSRFTMTPDALRQLAAASAATSQAPSHPRPAPHRRATTNQIAAASLPPVAPRISVAAPRNPLAPRVAKPVAADDLDADSDANPDDSGDLQRRRVATLHQHVEDSRSRHSRRSSVASSISESRGATGIPSRAARVARDAAPQFKRRQRRRRGVLGAVTVWVGVAAVALAAWRTHEQWELGFGNARADLAFQAPPSLPATPVVPDQIADLISAHLPDQIAQWARRARALVQPPPPLSCPEHAECATYAALHAWRAAEPGPRDQWVVDRAPVVQCDAGHVIEWPALAPRWVPRVPACVRDASTELRVRALADALVAECAAHRGRVQCEGSLLDHARARLPRWANQSADHAQIADEADEIERLGVSVADLRRQFVDRGSSDYMFRLAVDELAAQRGADVAHYVVEYEEEEGEGDGAPVERAFFVARRADLPLMCRVRRVALDALLGNLPALLGAVGAAVVALVVSRRVAARRAERRAAEALVGSALRRLKRQARRHYLDPALSPSPAIPSLQLRDLLLLSGGGAGPASLPDTPESEAAIMGGGAGGGAPAAAVYYDPRARAGVWDRVRAVVERSANVRCRTTAVRGEPMRVWEWIGPLDDDSDEGMDAFSPFASPFGSPQRVLSPGPL